MRTILKYDLEGNFLEEITADTLKSLSEKEGVSSSLLLDNLKGRNSTCNNFQYMEKTDKIRLNIPSAYHLKTGRPDKPLVKLYKGKIISVYNTLNEASYKNRISVLEILSCLQGTRKVNGFSFAWVEKIKEKKQINNELV